MELIKPTEPLIIRPTDLSSVQMAASVQLALTTINDGPGVSLVLFDHVGQPFGHVTWTPQQWSTFVIQLRDALLAKR
jgi:hypothetical protein